MVRARRIYLGTERVPDVGVKGLSDISEVKGISEAIVKDYKGGKIDRQTATRILNLLKLVVARDKDFQEPTKLTRAYDIIDSAIKERMALGEPEPLTTRVVGRIDHALALPVYQCRKCKRSWTGKKLWSERIKPRCSRCGGTNVRVVLGRGR